MRTVAGPAACLACHLQPVVSGCAGVTSSANYVRLKCIKDIRFLGLFLNQCCKIAKCSTNFDVGCCLVGLRILNLIPFLSQIPDLI